MAVYRGETAPILPLYEARGLVTKIDGMGEMDVVGTHIASILDGEA